MTTAPQEVMVEVRCRCCHGLVGIAPSDFRVYCPTGLCSSDPRFHTATAEGRDALIQAIFEKTGRSKTSIAEEFGVSRQRIDQILNDRHLRA